MDIILMLLGFGLLVIGGEFLVRASVALSFKLNISKMVVGLTVVSFATSLPELLVSLNAALNGSPSIAINNVIGSNIANIGLVLGITALIGTIYVDKSFYKINWPAMMVFSFAFYYFLSNDSKLDAVEGAVLFLSLLLFIAYSLKQSEGIETDDSMDAFTMISNFKIVIWLIIGGVALYFGAKWLVDGAVVIAQKIGVSEAVISVSVIAVGTSIPELAASVIAVLRKEKAISLGNLIGSNIFNIGSVLGMTAMVKPIVVDDPEILSRDIIWMLVFAGLLLPLTLILKRYEIKKLEGFLMVLLYGVFIYSVFL
ncbi:MAG: calcium/sodium antiporter [Flavobacteriaceae bacterium]|jgi:cation:H+ antiporter|nr:calcium/sodium antiporter [Flavobacteriaceae bacterium]MDA7728344.1 calcium/sodium antiporter [Flavobacteriaceae bacterium]MDA7849092.1 calcium/sodium antiporter [Flavobacteriaceae bacterium]MDG1310009.1 calcium/sodium antiporter [Flavobacteriaceae bacterium]|tara:strand:- start:11825 stop:12760 length:936 start_codon:yes stop_codon:yes gene_type:complete